MRCILTTTQYIGSSGDRVDGTDFSSTFTRDSEDSDHHTDTFLAIIVVVVVGIVVVVVGIVGIVAAVAVFLYRKKPKYVSDHVIIMCYLYHDYITWCMC